MKVFGKMLDQPENLHPVCLGDLAPDFEARTTAGTTRLSDFRGRWLLLFSHPADFTPVCTSEFLAFAKARPRFEALGCALLALSVDSLYAHLAWIRAIKDHFDVEIDFPIIEDPSMAICRAYGMISPCATDAATLRATFFIDPEGIVRAISCYPATIGRSVDEILRTLEALQRVDARDVITPEGWRPGDDVMLPPSKDRTSVLATPRGEAWFFRTCPDQGPAQ